MQYYNRFLQQLATHRPTTLQLAPPLVAFLAGHPMVTQDHLASLKTVSSHQNTTGCIVHHCNCIV